MVMQWAIEIVASVLFSIDLSLTESIEMINVERELASATLFRLLCEGGRGRLYSQVFFLELSERQCSCRDPSGFYD